MTTAQRHSDDALSALLAESGPAVFFAACNSPELVAAQVRCDVARDRLLGQRWAGFVAPEVRT